ncbi:hypothetical protein H8B06_08045 [Sphingobacterium sp. DN00404]|uniref:Polysaccharide deacetylase n=1 Tax=Sphingobacterium micropteri TaxID=2763501 RepID=A0ABR7YN63_9SPHI|nr:hypothetical protein [Sphingobacterium micropteri]MBD1432770.1 hypothetical protein [Sphingobacterium micropteri]
MNKFLLIFFTLLYCSCIKKDLYKDTDNDNTPITEEKPIDTYRSFSYPWAEEITGPEAEITIAVDGLDPATLNDLSLSIPPLKYNKSLLFMLTQDDCKQSAFCKTWAAINGRPITSTGSDRNYYYDIEQLEADDLPPNTFALGKTLGSMDGHGKEVRFHFTTTLAPEWDFMSAAVDVNRGFDAHYFRFYMKSGLRWNNVREMLNYGTGIAFHDVKADDVSNVSELVSHLMISQDIVLDSLDGRGIKFMAEPNGNKNYLAAAQQYEDIQTLTAQAGGLQLIPYRIDSDLTGTVVERVFATTSEVKQMVINQMYAKLNDRKAVYVGLHETDNDFVQLLLWLNEQYGKDGMDSLWFPSQEEYYEYNYYRHHCDIKMVKNEGIIKINIKFPEEKHFYYPSLTLNLSGLPLENILSVTSNSSVTGLSYGTYKDGVSINFDCRKYLYDQANYYVDKYLSTRNINNLRDANYFVNMLKDTPQKDVLLEKIAN